RSGSTTDIGADLYISQGGLLPINGTFAAAVDVSSSMAGKIGTGGGLSATAGSTVMNQAGKEGKQGSLNSILNILVPALAGKTGVDGNAVPVLSNALLNSAGKTGNQGQIDSQVSLSALLFGSVSGGSPQTIFEGTLAGAAGELDSELFGNVGVDGSFTSQIILAASLAGQLGATGSYTMLLDGVSSLIEGVMGVSGEITTTVSAGADMAGKLGISADIVASLDDLGLQLIEITRSEKIYQIILSIQSGQVVLQAPKFGKIDISTLI
ncbi:MAG: hypothetical protein MI862_23615, partial [Desulfobacterales bacterium]|nr:hypothetical protein [Desulfobacterales bacterium]